MIALSENMVSRNYRVHLNDNTEIVGKCISYIQAKDNDPEIDSIWIEDKQGKITEIYLNDIKGTERI